MAAVDPRLMVRLEKALGLSKRRVQELVQESARVNRVSRDIAAFIVAGDNGISYDRYASAEQMAVLRGVPTHLAVPPTAKAVPIPPPTKPTVKTRTIKTTKNNSLFVVHGRDNQLNEDMFAFLRAIGLNPMEWNQAVKAAKGANPNVTEIVRGALQKVQGVIVLFSPDEEARLKSKFRGPKDEKSLQSQARPNVIFEAGIALGAYQEKTLLVEVGDIRKISDIAGMHILQLNNRATSRKELAQRLKDKLKFKVDTSGNSWLTVGNFDR
ncbi:nucleotide-binding protein [Pseudolabrys sp. Root1462]|uniref:TIR domain-containing protein n=1 Tax=Pseudolabrys sp. Root1462 TaxID=1736466 RepID=UPI000AA4DC5C|nr:nucleotide-binding protein [Pseudolabrys sp. Root1462]